MNAELVAIHANAAARRAAGALCNPLRDGVCDADWMDADELQRVHVLAVQMKLPLIDALRPRVAP